MSYQVIARKYRPQRFADVVGQEHVTATLANAIRAGRIAHAYLFCGPRGTGKTTLARIFAKALNCADGPKAEFDVADPRVVEIGEGRSLDVLEIDGASNNGVEQVRELRETARFAPSASRFKIYIIDEVHMLSSAAFNALLKTLEEPPAHVKFLFATTDPEKVLPTILSRCQRFDLRRIPAALIARHLGWIAQQEGVVADAAALEAIARGADGGMRDAESALDQLISFSGAKIEETDVLSMYGLAGRGQLIQLARAVLQGDANSALRGFDELARSGKDLGRLLGDLLGHFRNLLVYLVSQGDAGLMEASEGEFQALAGEAQTVDAETVVRILDVFTVAEGRFRDAPSRRIFLEVTLLKAIQARRAVTLDFVLRQLKTLRDQEGIGEVLKVPALVPASASTAFTGVPPSFSTQKAAPVPEPQAVQAVAAPAEPTPGPPPVVAASPAPELISIAPPVAARPVAPATVAAASASPSSVPRPEPIVEATQVPAASADVWRALLEGARGEPMLRAHLVGGSVVSYVGGVLTVAVPEAHLDWLSTPARMAKVCDLAKAAGAAIATVRWIAGAEPPSPIPEVVPAASAPAGPPLAAKPALKPVKVAPVRLNLDDFKNDPLIRAALEVFRAQLVEVRGPDAGA